MVYDPKRDYYPKSEEYTGPRTGDKGQYKDYVPSSSSTDAAPPKPEEPARPDRGKRDGPKRDWVKIINSQGARFWATYRTMPFKQRESIIRSVNDMGILKAIGEYEKLPKLQEMVTERLSTL